MTLLLLSVLIAAVSADEKYVVAPNALTHPAAVDYCSKKGLYLVIPKNQSETNEIRALLPSGDVRAWLGFQKVNGRWTPDNPNYGKILWTNWAKNEGNSGSPNAGIIWQRGHNGKWYDMIPGPRKHYAVCSLAKAPTEAPIPAPTSSPTEEASYGKIIEWLKELIADARAEIESVETKTAILTGKVKTAQDVLQMAQIAEREAQAAANIAAAAYAASKGEWEVCKDKFERESIRLQQLPPPLPPPPPP